MYIYIYIRYAYYIKIYTYMNKYWCWVIDLAYFNICPTNMTTLPNRKTCIIFFWQWVILRVSVSWWDGQKFLSYWLRSQINVGRIEDYTGYESSVLHVAYIASSLWTWYSHRKLAHHGYNQKMQVPSCAKHVDTHVQDESNLWPSSLQMDLWCFQVWGMEE